MTNFQVWLRGKKIGTFNCPYETALFATNTDVKIDFPPRTEIFTDSKEMAETWTHFEFKEDM